VLKELNHPNVIGIKDVFHLKGLLFFVQEYGGVDLEKLVFFGDQNSEQIVLNES
jgi:hypothetical protein